MVAFNKKVRRGQAGDIRRYRAPQLFNRITKEEQKSFFPNWSFKIIIYIILFCALAYVFLFSSWFKIGEIMIEGNSLLSKELVKESIPIGQNIFLLNIDKTRTTLLKRFPEIKSVEIYRGIPNAIKIVLLEREGKIRWQSGDSVYLISDQGEVVRKIIGDEGKDSPKIIDKTNLPVVPGTQLVSPSFIAFVSNVNTNFYEIVNIKPLDFEVGETTFDVVLRTDAGFYVKLNTLRSSKKQLENLKKVLVAKRQDVKEYVDIRIDGWAYYK
jgi:cell division septal protein FtsQ